MSDSPRPDGSRAYDVAADAERDAKIEQLLLIGLDHYFAGRFEQAINVWTRALFLDRSHPRARAYIDRARSALAERQRESEELLQRGVAAFDRGESEEARRLLRAAIDGGAPADEAHALLGRLSRAQTSVFTGAALEDRVGPPASIAHVMDVAVEEAAAGRKTQKLVWALIGVGVAGVMAGGWWIAAQNDFTWPSLLVRSDRPAGPTLAPAPREAGLPLPRRGEMALERARALAASGQLHEALKVLDSVRPTDEERTEADRVRSNVQRQLLALIPVQESARRQKTGRRP
jgi:tetratricopeptide (TPR) repeat protein